MCLDVRVSNVRVSNVRVSTRLSHTKDTNSCFAGVRVRAFIVDVCMWSCPRTHAPRAHTWVFFFLCTHTGVLAVLTVGILIAGYGHTAMHSEQAAHMLHGVFMYLTPSL